MTEPYVISGTYIGGSRPSWVIQSETPLDILAPDYCIGANRELNRYRCTLDAIRQEGIRIPIPAEEVVKDAVTHGVETAAKNAEKPPQEIIPEREDAPLVVSRPEVPDSNQNMVSYLLIGAGALILGGIAYYLLSHKEQTWQE